MILILNNKANFDVEQIKKYEKEIRKYNIIVLPSICYLPLFKRGKYSCKYRYSNNIYSF